jgi:hypothetical protein
MRSQHDRALKEWAVACEAMKAGRQIVLIRKGGIREDDGVFRVNDPEFFLLPTYEHQNPELLQHGYKEQLAKLSEVPPDPATVRIDTYAMVDTVRTCEDEETLRRIASEHIWNEQYLQMRLNFNPYDPLYVLILKVFRLPEPVALPMRPEYTGCVSWVTLEHSISTAGAVPAVNDRSFEERRAELLDILDGLN